MTRVGLGDRQPVLLDVFRYHVAQFPVHDSRLADTDRQLQRAVSLLYQELRALGDLADSESLVQVSVKPVFEGADIQVHDIAGH